MIKRTMISCQPKPIIDPSPSSAIAVPTRRIMTFHLLRWRVESRVPPENPRKQPVEWATSTADVIRAIRRIPVLARANAKGAKGGQPYLILLLHRPPIAPCPLLDSIARCPLWSHLGCSPESVAILSIGTSARWWWTDGDVLGALEVEV